MNFQRLKSLVNADREDDILGALEGSPERRLICAILFRAYRDLNSKEELIRRDAEAYFFAEDDYFCPDYIFSLHCICDHLSYDLSVARKFAHELIGELVGKKTVDTIRKRRVALPRG